jgi:DNA-binding CsgD family transcriptional regulator
MQMVWSLVCLVGLLLAVNVALWVRRFRERKAEATAKALSREMVFMANCTSFELSVREIGVLRLILEGKTYKEVGELLFISEKTVDSHMQNIYAKVGVRNKLSLLNTMYN